MIDYAAFERVIRTGFAIETGDRQSIRPGRVPQWPPVGDHQRVRVRG